MTGVVDGSPAVHPACRRPPSTYAQAIGEGTRLHTEQLPTSMVDKMLGLQNTPRSAIDLAFCRAMLCKRGLCRHAVSICLSVRLSVCHVREFCQNK